VRRTSPGPTGFFIIARVQAGCQQERTCPISLARLEQFGQATRAHRPLPQNALVTFPELVRALNVPDGPRLYIVLSHDPDRLREFAIVLGHALYEDRCRSGQFAPLVSFIFDEADEFTPLQARRAPMPRVLR
jgi:hypothetical protein